MGVVSKNTVIENMQGQVPPDVTSGLRKATTSVLVYPLVIVAFPLVNAYICGEEEKVTGYKFLDYSIGGLCGVIGWPLSPFLAAWGVYKSIFKDPPVLPLPVAHDIKLAARQKMGINCDSYFNIAVVGAVGTGKSSVINGIMGRRDNDEKAAPTGEVETTSKPRGYLHPDLSRLTFWDMPGAGTMQNPASTYFEDNFLVVFDALIIVTAERFREIDIEIALKAMDQRIPVFFVRNKADQAILARMRRSPDIGDHLMQWRKAVGELQEDVKRNVVKQLKSYHIKRAVPFILSAWALQEFVSMVSMMHVHTPERNLQLIDEERFMKKLFKAVGKKRGVIDKLKRKTS